MSDVDWDVDSADSSSSSESGSESDASDQPKEKHFSVQHTNFNEGQLKLRITCTGHRTSSKHKPTLESPCFKTPYLRDKDSVDKPASTSQSNFPVSNSLLYIYDLI